MRVVMHNNLGYYNTGSHHDPHGPRCAAPTETKAHIVMDLYGRRPDFRHTGALHGVLRRRASDNPK